MSDFEMADSSSPGRGRPSFGDERLSSKPPLGPIIGEIVGTATKLSTHLCSILGKSWISYASWCFSMARGSLLTPNENTLHSCSFLPILVHEVLPERFKLTEDEIIKVESLILQLVQNKDDEGCRAEQGESNYFLDSAELRNATLWWLWCSK
ncbi:unnamed protein product [Prunus armeniaca]|uniref:Uncharacterized protein n=1 Tax=Prunus armeniaca TaxID=36596 RepID=A0A6J5Y490_PRUAR|nr:unnamed protein product [Prunus armeniaca]